MTDDGFGFDDDSFEDDGFDDGFGFDDDPFGDIGGGLDEGQDIDYVIEQFDVEVDRQITILRSNKKHSASERAEAARWLGESGRWQAIPTLITIYQKDKKNKDVQKAAEYALGQFKALDKAVKRKKGQSVAEALQAPKNAKIYQQLMDIATEDKRGSRLRIPASVLWFVLLILLISFGVFAYLGYTTYNDNESKRKYEAQFAELIGTPEQIEVAKLQILVSDARDDARSIRQQLNNSLECETSYHSTIDYEIDATTSQVVSELATQYNAANEQLRQVRAGVDAACAGDGGFPETLLTDVGVTIETLNTIRDDVNSLADEIDTQLQADADAATATANAQATADVIATAEASITPTLTLTLTPTPGIPDDALRTELNILYRIVTDSADGIAVLRSYWENVRDAGETIGCTRPVEIIPEDHELPENYGLWNPDLQNAANLTNGSLALARDSWELFTTACTEGTLEENYQIGLSLVDLAQQASTEADGALNELLGFGSGLEAFETPTPEAAN